MGDEDDDEVPFVINYDIGIVTDNGVAIRLTYATSRQRYEAREWDTAVYVMNRELATGYAKAVLRQTGETPRPSTRPRIH